MSNACQWLSTRYEASAWFRLFALSVVILFGIGGMWVILQIVGPEPNEWFAGGLVIAWMIALSGWATWLLTWREPYPSPSTSSQVPPARNPRQHTDWTPSRPLPPAPRPAPPEPAPILSHLDEARLHYESSYRQMLDAKEALEKARGWDSAHPSRE